jgi:hypothetical protein
MIIADEILDLLKRKRRLKLTATAIAEILYWEAGPTNNASRPAV